jgi:ribonuclease BN (tRNA processing enzyme)
VLSHLVPADTAGMTEQKWVDAVRPTFQGEVVVAHDLMEILL